MIIVTYNSHEQLSDIQASIHEFIEDNSGNFAVVMENSGDRRIAAEMSSDLPPDRFMVEVSPVNVGFSHGVNNAYALARQAWGRFDFVVLLNPDVLSAGRAVSELVNRASLPSEADYGIWSAPLRNEHGEYDKGCARRQWNLRRLFSDLLGYPPLSKALLTASRHLSPQEIDSDQSELALVSGALMCIRADVFSDGLDTHLPMYLEDQEICLRNLNSGYKVRLYPDLEIVHLGGVSRKSNPDVQRALKIMENVEAPVQCMVRIQGYNITRVRPVVFFGGLFRFALAPVVAGFEILRRGNVSNEASWLSDQLKLGYWCIWWALRGNLHQQEISLQEYFREYSRD